MFSVARHVSRGAWPRALAMCVLACAWLALEARPARAELTLQATYPASFTAAAVASDGSIYTCNRDGIVKRAPDLSVVYETRLSGNSSFRCAAVAVAGDGSVVAVGHGFPKAVIKLRNALKAASDSNDNGCGLVSVCSDGIIFRLDPHGALVQGSFVGVDFSIDELTDVAVFANGDVVVGGRTTSHQFPTTPGTLGETSKTLPKQPNQSGDVYEGVVLRFSARGVLQWSTFVGGPVGGVAAHPSGDVIVSLEAGHQQVPWTVTAVAAAYNRSGQLVRINGDASGVAWATLLDAMTSYHPGPLAVDQWGNIYAAPTGNDATVRLFTADGVPVWSTLMPGRGETLAADLVVSPETGHLLLTGTTASQDMSTTAPPLDVPRSYANQRTFVARFTGRGVLLDARLLTMTRYGNGFPGGGLDHGVTVAPWTQNRVLAASTHGGQNGRFLVLGSDAPGAAPAVDVQPATGDAAGGSVVQIVGGPFDAGSAVFFGSAPAPRVALIHAGLLEVTIPAGSGSVPVTVFTGSGARTTRAGAFTYAGQACTPSIGDDQARLASGGGVVEVPSAGCLGTRAWSTAPWLTVLVQANSTLRLEVGANPGSQREAVAWHGTRGVKVVQGPGSCGLDVQPVTLDIGPDTAVVPITATPTAGCRMNQVEPPAWIQQRSFSNNLEVADPPFTTRLVIAANSTGADREGSVTLTVRPDTGEFSGAVSTRQVTVRQRAVAVCDPVVPAALSIAAEGGPFTVNVSAPAGCSWAAGNDTAWLGLRQPASGVGNGTVTSAADANMTLEPRTAIITVGARQVAVTQAAATCQYDVAGDTIAAPAYRSTIAVPVFAARGCPFTASTTAAWITASTTEAWGNGQLTITVEDSSLPAPRVGTVTVGNRVITVRQEADQRCTPELSTRLALLPAAASTTHIGVTSAGRCGIVTRSKDAWLSVSADASGATVSAAANPTATPREGVVIIANRALRVRQAGSGAGCAAALPFTTFQVGSGVTSMSVPVTAAAGCGWTAATPTPWLTVVDGASGTGSGTVTLTVAAPTESDTFTDRTGTLTVAGQQITVRQAGPRHARQASIAADGTATTGYQDTFYTTVASADGNIVAFLSSAVLTVDTVLSSPNLFVRDHLAGTTVMVSRNPETGESGNQPAIAPVISADGRYIAWTSRASNLAAGADGGDRVYLYDRANARIVYHAVGVNPTLSRDGRVLAFERPIFRAGHEVLVRDRDPDRNGIFDEAGVADRLVGDGRLEAFTPMLSADGRHLAVVSGRYLDDSVAAAQTPAAVIDLETQQLRFVSVSSDGRLNDASVNTVVISATGRFVTFRSTALALVRNVFGQPGGEHVYLHDRDADEDGIYDEPGAISTEQVDVEDAAVNSIVGPTWVSADGTRLVYRGASGHQFRMRDRRTGQARSIRPVDLYTNGPVAENTGRFVAFAEAGAAWTLDAMGDIASPVLEQAGPMLLMGDGSGRLALEGRALDFPYVLLDGTPLHGVRGGSDRAATLIVPASRLNAATVTVRPWFGPESSTRTLTAVPCTYVLAPSSMALTGAGGTPSTSVARSDARCPIEVDTSAAPWIEATVDGETVRLDVEQHLGLTPRSATVLVSGQPLLVQQTAGVGGPVITSYSPTRGGNAGDVTMRLVGRGFTPDMQFRLRRSGSTDIVARAVRVRADGQVARGVLDLRGQALGEWRIVLHQEGRDYATGKLFVVEEPRPATFTCTFEVPTSLAVGVRATVRMTCVNVGNMDSGTQAVMVRTPPADDVTFLNVLPGTESDESGRPPLNDVPTPRAPRTGEPLVPPPTAPGDSATQDLTLTPKRAGTFEFEVWTSELDVLGPSSAQALACINATANFVIDMLGAALPGGACVGRVVQTIGSVLADIVSAQQELTDPPSPTEPPVFRKWTALTKVYWLGTVNGTAVGTTLLQCARTSVPLAGQWISLLDAVDDLGSAVDACSALLEPRTAVRQKKRVVVTTPTNDSCRAYWSPYSQHLLGPDGGTRRVFLDIGASCAWDLSFSGPPEWLNVSPAKGIGPATITLTVAPYNVTCPSSCDRFHDFVADGLDGLNLGVRQSPRRVSISLKYAGDGLTTLVRVFFPTFLRFGMAAPVNGASSVTLNGIAAPFEMEDENTMVVAVGGIPAGTPIVLEAMLADGRTVREVLPNQATTATAATDTDADGIPDLWEIRYGLDPDFSADALMDSDGDGVVNRLEYERGSHPSGAFASYLAEGANSQFFDMRLALANPGALPANVLVRFLDTAGVARAHSLALAPRSRATIQASDIPGLGANEFSTVVESDRLVVVDRTMTWQGPGGYGSHAETGAPAPSSTWYLAEGSTNSGFELFYLLQNPSTRAVEARVRYLRTAGAPLDKTYTLPPQSRTNIWVNLEQFEGLGQALDDAEVSAVIDALDGTPIVVERAMYLSRGGRLFDAGHESAGVTAPATSWFLAEGATGPYFDLFVLVANPNDQPVDVEFTYLLADGRTFRRVQTAAANSRSTVWVDYETFPDVADLPLADVAVSTTVRSLTGLPIIVERAMWWPGSYDTWAEAHNSAGSTRTGVEWVLADGEVGGPTNVETYVLMANTSGFAGEARVTLLFEDGTTAERLYALPASSRVNAAIGNDFGAEVAGRRFATVVTSLGPTPAQIVVERAMYHDAGGMSWAAGSNAAGTRVR